MGISDWRPILSQIDCLGQDESNKLREALEKCLESPEAILSNAPEKYKEDRPLREVTEDELITLVARRLLWPIVEPFQNELASHISDFINTPETQSFIKNDPLPKTAQDRIKIKEFGVVRRKYIEPLQDEFAKRLAPLVREMLAKQQEPAKPFRSPFTPLKSFLTYFIG